MTYAVPDISGYNYNMPIDKGKGEEVIPNASPMVPLIPKKNQ